MQSSQYLEQATLSIIGRSWSMRPCWIDSAPNGLIFCGGEDKDFRVQLSPTVWFRTVSLLSMKKRFTIHMGNTSMKID